MNWHRVQQIEHHTLSKCRIIHFLTVSVSDSVVIDLSHMFDDSESTCVSTTSLVQSLNRYFARLNISKVSGVNGEKCWNQSAVQY